MDRRILILGVVLLATGIGGVVALSVWSFVSANATATPPGAGSSWNAPTMLGRGMLGRGMMGGNTQPPGFAPPAAATATPPAANAPAPQDNATLTPQPNARASAANSATQKAGNWNVTLALTPYPPVSFQTATFDMTLTDANGEPITDAQVGLDLTMPSMWMPSNKPQAKSLGAGRYQATGRFTMRGAWQIAVIIQRGAEKQIAYFQLGL